MKLLEPTATPLKRSVLFIESDSLFCGFDVGSLCGTVSLPWDGEAAKTFRSVPE